MNIDNDIKIPTQSVKLYAGIFEWENLNMIATYNSIYKGKVLSYLLYGYVNNVMSFSRMGQRDSKGRKAGALYSLQFS